MSNTECDFIPQIGLERQVRPISPPRVDPPLYRIWEEPGGRTPLAVILLYFMVAASFLIYIPVSYFDSNLPLFVLDCSLLVALVPTIGLAKKRASIFRGRIGLFASFGLFLLPAILWFVFSIPNMSAAIATTFRNLLFGVGVILISSAWLTTTRRLDTMVAILLIGTVCIAIYGLRQLIFGFYPFELARLGKMGGSLLEMETLGRIRITSTFGDPLTFGVFLMLGHFVYFIARARNLCLFLTRKTHPASLILLSICLLLTLTRAPMLGLVCGGILAAVLTFRITRKHLAKAAMAVASLAVVIIGLNAIISSQTFAASNNPVINSIQNGAESAWSLSQMAMGGSDDAESAFLVSQSKDDRSRAWTTGLEFLRSNPLGGGLAVDNIFSFSPGDVGLLAVGLQVGIIGLVALIATLLSVGLHGLAGLRSTHHSEARGVPILFLAAWVGILVTNGVTLLLETSVLAIPIWIFAGFILNSKQIFNSSSRPI